MLVFPSISFQLGYIGSLKSKLKAVTKYSVVDQCRWLSRFSSLGFYCVESSDSHFGAEPLSWPPGFSRAVVLIKHLDEAALNNADRGRQTLGGLEDHSEVESELLQSWVLQKELHWRTHFFSHILRPCVVMRGETWTRIPDSVAGKVPDVRLPQSWRGYSDL